jgi:hypothetical protein
VPPEIGASVYGAVLRAVAPKAAPASAPGERPPAVARARYFGTGARTNDAGGMRDERG